MAGEDETKEEANDETMVSVEIDGTAHEMTTEQLQQHVQASMRGDVREAELTQREGLLTANANSAQRMSEFERMMQEDPDAALKLVYDRVGREAPGAEPPPPADPMSEIPDEEMSPALRKVFTGLNTQISDLKARDNTREQRAATEQAGRDLDRAVDKFPQYKGDHRDALKAMVASMSSQTPSAPMDQIAQIAHEAIKGLVTAEAQSTLDGREAKESQRQMDPGKGTPQLTQPKAPFTDKERKNGSIAEHVAQQLREHAGFH